jgi:hypothetical protein
VNNLKLRAPVAAEVFENAQREVGATLLSIAA